MRDILAHAVHGPVISGSMTSDGLRIIPRPIARLPHRGSTPGKPGAGQLAVLVASMAFTHGRRQSRGESPPQMPMRNNDDSRRFAATTVAAPSGRDPTLAAFAA